LTADWSGSLAPLARLVDETFFATLGTHADVMISSQSASRSFACFVIPTNAGLDAVRIVQNAVEGAWRRSSSPHGGMSSR
jgi:hypothetical protein